MVIGSDTMPNWVKTIVHAVREDANFNKFTDENGNFTFQKIVPMPDDIYRGDLGEEERKKYGSRNWYDWSLEHWGTKWDACEARISEDGKTVDFDTAWSVAEPVLAKLGELVGGIIVFYSDEGIDENSGAFLVHSDGNVDDLGVSAVAHLAIYSGKDVYDREEVIEEYEWQFEEDDE